MSDLRRQNPKKVAGAGPNLKLTRHHVQDPVALRFVKPTIDSVGGNRQLLPPTDVASFYGKRNQGTNSRQDCPPVFAATRATCGSAAGETEKGLRQGRPLPPLVYMFFLSRIDSQWSPLAGAPANILI